MIRSLPEATCEERRGCLLFRFPGSGKEAPRAALSLAVAGDMGYRLDGANPNRAALFSAFGLGPEPLPGSGPEGAGVAGLKLAHSRIVYRAGEGGDWRPGLRGDGVASPPGGPIPSVTVADCMPIWIYDRARGIRALVHSGWQGTGIAASCITLMARSWGTRPGDCSALLGPSIKPCCYPVPPERAVQYLDSWGPEAAVFEAGSWRLDLVAANASLLESLGVADICVAPHCTCCDARFGSSRREGNSHFTKMAAFFIPANT